MYTESLTLLPIFMIVYVIPRVVVRWHTDVTMEIFILWSVKFFLLSGHLGDKDLVRTGFDVMQFLDHGQMVCGVVGAYEHVHLWVVP